MPRVMAGDVDLYYESLGEGTPFVLQGHDHTAWLFGQAPVFSQRYRVLVYDRRGTGRSSSPDGDWSAADLAGDLENFLDALGHRARDRRRLVPRRRRSPRSSRVDYPERALALIIGHTVPYLDDVGRAWLERQVADARAGRPVIARQPADVEGGEEPPTTDPAFAASPLGTHDRDDRHRSRPHAR